MTYRRCGGGSGPYHSSTSRSSAFGKTCILFGGYGSEMEHTGWITEGPNSWVRSRNMLIKERSRPIPLVISISLLLSSKTSPNKPCRVCREGVSYAKCSCKTNVPGLPGSQSDCHLWRYSSMDVTITHFHAELLGWRASHSNIHLRLFPMVGQILPDAPSQ